MSQFHGLQSVLSHQIERRPAVLSAGCQTTVSEFLCSSGATDVRTCEAMRTNTHTENEGEGGREGGGRETFQGLAWQSHQTTVYSPTHSCSTRDCNIQLTSSKSSSSSSSCLEKSSSLMTLLLRCQEGKQEQLSNRHAQNDVSFMLWAMFLSLVKYLSLELCCTWIRTFHPHLSKPWAVKG